MLGRSEPAVATRRAQRKGLFGVDGLPPYRAIPSIVQKLQNDTINYIGILRIYGIRKR